MLIRLYICNGTTNLLIEGALLVIWGIGGLQIPPNYARKLTTSVLRKRDPIPDILWRIQEPPNLPREFQYPLMFELR